MKQPPSKWPDLMRQWRATQDQLRTRAVVRPLSPLPRFVAGVDGAFSDDKKTIYAAAVVYDRESKQIVEVAHATAAVTVPYLPGYLSFREGPAVSAALANLKHPFGVVCFDGQGFAHPRRCGLATHIAVTLGVPGIGVAKSRYIGEFDEPGRSAGAWSPLTDKGETIGAVVRTRDGVNPVFVSVGHLVDLPSAIELVLSCVRKRVPEPTRQADIEVAKLKKAASNE